MDTNHNKPASRRKNVTSGGTGANKRGSGLSTGPVGTGKTGSKPSGRNMKRAAAGGGGGLLALLLSLFVLPKLFGGVDSGSDSVGDLVGTLLTGSQCNVPSGYSSLNEDMGTDDFFADDAVEADQLVAEGSREKYTNILGNGKDKVTLMIYMCGTDLESKHGMASSDLAEIASAKYGDNVNVIVYTGGCKKWATNGISNSVNQIYQVKDGRLKQLVADNGNKPMTDPNNLSGFIKYCSENFPANRNELILWDHGGGSVSGYGFDEKKGNDSMDLAEISKALKNGGVKFDFVGFDACLMATAETALMLNDYADYLIASEETEPGIGWYYTDWLTKLGSDTSMPTVEIGRNIVDDFVSACAVKCRGQKTTLSVIDLAEFSNTVPSKLNKFAESVSKLIIDKQYQTVSDARYGSREFAQKSKIDQIDLVDFAENMSNQEGKELSDAIKSAVKYNRTSKNMSNAHGVSIYFPYKRTSFVDSACSTYSVIGMSDSYSKCIRQFAKLETSGQIASGGTGSPLGSLFSLEGCGSTGSSGNVDVIGSLLGSFLSGRSVKVDGLDRNNTAYMNETSISTDDAADYLSVTYFDVNNLVWQHTGNEYKMKLPEAQQKLVHKLDLNMFYDDGEGYIDLGLDNVFSFDAEDNLIADTSKNWLAIDGHTVAYYHTDTVQNGNDYTITGYVPAYLNGERVELILIFDSEDPDGYIAGASTEYVNGETDTVPKNLTELNDGDKIDFICDYYSYDGEYSDSYYLGDTLTYSKDMKISNTNVGDGEVRLMYRFTDIYNQEYWSEPIIK